MIRSPGELQLVEEFDDTYLRSGSDVMLRMEKATLGSDYGATSWTTPAQADRLAELLELSPGVRLLDIGAGSGWPGLHLAASTGCEAFIADPSLEGIRIGARRAAADGIGDRCRAVVAAGGGLPFRDEMFHAVNHADVLC